MFLWFNTALSKNNKNNNATLSSQENRTTAATTAHENNNNTIPAAVVPSPPKVHRRDVPECLFIVRDNSSKNSDSNSNCWASPPRTAQPDDDITDDNMSVDISTGTPKHIATSMVDDGGDSEDDDDVFAASVDQQQEQIHYYNTPSPASEQGEQQTEDDFDADDDEEEDYYEENALDKTAKKEDFDAVRSPRRVRMNSRDIPRTYSGLYGDDDLLPFECQRQQRGTITSQSIWFLLFFYVTVVAGVQLLVSPSFLLNHHEDWVWTVTNFIHLAVTVPYIHWLKGSIFDPQGEMNALTIWEQLEARGSDSKRVRQLLLIAPTLLCYAACHFSGYRVGICGVNLIFWSIAILAKLPFMNGVRIFGINRTVGIDDTEDNENETKRKKKVL